MKFGAPRYSTRLLQVVATSTLVSLSFLPKSARADATFHLKPDRKYTVRIIDFVKDGDAVQRMLILKRNKVVIDQTFHGFAVVDPFHGEPNLGIEADKQPPLFDLNGDGLPDLIIRRWTGGAHGTYYYDFYTLRDPLTKLWTFSAGDGHLRLSKNSDRNHHLPVLYMEDATFRYWGPQVFKMPIVPIKWNGQRFAADRKLMVAEGTHDKMYDPKEYMTEPGSQADLLQRFVLLYYAGRAADAKQLITKIKWTGETSHGFHSEFVKHLKKSHFYEDVRAINNYEL